MFFSLVSWTKMTSNYIFMLYLFYVYRSIPFILCTCGVPKWNVTRYKLSSACLRTHVELLKRSGCQNYTRRRDWKPVQKERSAVYSAGRGNARMDVVFPPQSTYWYISWDTCSACPKYVVVTVTLRGGVNSHKDSADTKWPEMCRWTETLTASWPRCCGPWWFPACSSHCETHTQHDVEHHMVPT